MKRKDEIYLPWLNDEDDAIALGITSFFSWFTGKGFSRGKWLSVSFYGQSRSERRRLAHQRRRA